MRGAERAQGRLRSLAPMSAAAALSTSVADPSKLPSIEETTDLQDEDGNFFFLIGYSVVDGGDIIP